MCSSILRIPINIPLIALDYQAQMEFAMGTEVHCMSMYMDPSECAPPGGPVLRRSTRIVNRKSLGTHFLWSGTHWVLVPPRKRPAEHSDSEDERSENRVPPKKPRVAKKAKKTGTPKGTTTTKGKGM